MRYLTLAALLVALAVSPMYAIDGTIGFDVVPGDPGFAGQTVTDDDSDIDTAVTINVGEDTLTLVRLNGANNLLGVTFDFSFDPAVLQVVDIHETRMDLDFSGQKDFAELNAIVAFFLEQLSDPPANTDELSYTYNDGTGEITTQPGILIDLDGDGQFSFVELNSYIDEFIRELSGNDTPFWTEVQSKKGGFNESVEVHDLVADINAAGGAEDNTVVLLRRPETAQDGFGFDGNAILLEVTFRGAAAGNSDLTVTNAQGITETFSNVNSTDPVTGISPVASAVTSNITVQ